MMGPAERFSEKLHEPKARRGWAATITALRYGEWLRSLGMKLLSIESARSACRLWKGSHGLKLTS
jgi:hypothetical protein